MFDKFGEFDSAREINQLAENLFNEGDFNSIRVVANSPNLSNISYPRFCS